MRYSSDEDTVLVGILGESNLDVYIKIIDLYTDTLVELKDNKCIESKHMPGIYRWFTKNIKNNNFKSEYHNLFYKMYAANDSEFYGKIVFSGFVDKDVSIDMSEHIEDHQDIKDTLDIINARI